MSFETEQEQQRRSREAREGTIETQESGRDEQLLQAAALERADILQKEIRTSKKQMQNIVLHIQQVTAAIAALRQQLQLSAASTDPASVRQDKEKVTDLKKKIAGYQGELLKMRDDLIREQIEVLKSEGFAGGAGEIAEKAKAMVEQLIRIG